MTSWVTWRNFALLTLLFDATLLFANLRAAYEKKGVIEARATPEDATGVIILITLLMMANILVILRMIENEHLRD